MLTDFADLGLTTKLLIVLGPLLFVVALVFSFRVGEFTWPNIAVLGIAMIVLLLPSIQKFSVGKDAVSFELFQQSVGPARDALSALQKANEDNSRALTALRETITDLKTQYAELLNKQASALATFADRGQTSRPTPPATPGQPLPPVPPSTEQQNAAGLQQDLTRIQNGLTLKLDQAQQSIQSATPNNEIARGKIRDIDAVLRQVR